MSDLKNNNNNFFRVQKIKEFVKSEREIYKMKKIFKTFYFKENIKLHHLLIENIKFSI